MPLPQRTLLQNTPKAVRNRSERCSIRTKQQGKYIKHDEYGNVFEIRYNVRCLDGEREVILRYIGKQKPGLKKDEVVHGIPANDSPIWLSCSCPYHLFYVEYALAQTGNTDILYSNGNPPVIKNPDEIPYVCKHSYLALQTAVEEYKNLGELQDVLNKVKLEPAPVEKEKPVKPIIPENVIDTIHEDIERVEKEINKQPSPKETPQQLEQKEKKKETIFNRVQKAIDRIKNIPPFRNIRNVIDRLKKKIFKNKPRKENIEVQDVDDLKKELKLIEDVNESKEASISNKLLHIASLLDKK